MKERKTSLFKRFAALVLCICMITVTFGTAVFAEKGTASTTDDLLLTMEDFTGLEIEKETPFVTNGLSGITDGMMIGSNATGRLTLHEDNTFSFGRPADSKTAQDSYIYSSFGETFEWETMPGKITASVAIEPPASTLIDGATAGSNYTSESIGFYGLDENGAKVSSTLANFSTSGSFSKINGNSTSSQQNVTSNIDFDADGLYEFRIEIEKDFGDPSGGTNEIPFWYVRIFSEEEGDKNDTLIFWIRYGVNEAASGSTAKVPNIAGMVFGVYANGGGKSIFNTNITFHELNVAMDRFKATSATDIFYEGGNGKVEFNRELDTDTLAGITLTDASGNTIPANVTAAGSTATVTPTAILTAGADYKINIANTVKSENGECVTASTLNIKAIDSIFNFDFENWDVTADGETLTPADLTAKSDGVITDNYANASGYDDSIVDNGDGTKSLKLLNGYNGGDNVTYFAFPKHTDYATVGDKITARIRIKKITDNGNYSRIGWYKVNSDGTKSFTAAIHIDATGKLYRLTSSSSDYGWLDATDFDTQSGFGDNDGWYNLRIVLEKGYDTFAGSSNGTAYWEWTSTVYATEGGVEKMVYRNAYFGERTDASYNLTALDGLAAMTRATSTSMIIDSLSVEFERIKSTSCSGSAFFDDGSVNIGFNREMVSTVTPENTTLSNITVTDAQGETVAYTPSAVGSSVILKFGQLINGATYTINIPATVQTADKESVLPATYTFKAVDSTIDEDFSTWTGVTQVDTSTATNGYDETKWFDEAKLSELSNGLMSGNSGTRYQLNTDGSLSSYLPFNNGQTARLYMPFGKSITAADPDKKITFYVKSKKEGIIEKFTDATTGAVTYGAATTSGKGNGIQFYITGTNSSGAAVEPSIGNQDYINGSLNRPGGLTHYIDNTAAYISDYSVVDGYYNLRFEITKEPYTRTGVQDCWVIRQYDNVTEKLLLETYYATETISAIDGVAIGTAMYGSAAPYLMGRITIKDPKVILSDVEATCTDVVYYNKGEIYLRFNRVIDDTTVAGITLTDENGNSVSVTPSVTEDLVTLAVNDVLVKGKPYTVTVPATVLSAGGEAAKNQTFTVNAGNVIMQQSFESLEEGKVYLGDTVSKVHPLIQPKTYQAISQSSKTGTRFRVSNGALYFDHTDIGGQYEEDMTLVLPNAFSSGSYAFEFVMKPHVQTAGGRTLPGQMIMTGSGFTRGTASNWSAAKGSSYTDPKLTVNENGEWHLKIVASKADTSANWVYAAYDLNSSTPYYPIAFSQGGTGSLSDYMMKISRAQSARETDSDCYYIFKSIKVYEEEESGAAYAGALGANAGAIFTRTGNVVTWKGTLYGRKVNGEFPKVLLCAYDTDGELLGVKIHEMTTERAAAEITLTLDEGVIPTKAKLMIIDNYDNVVPLIDAVEK